MSIYEIIFSAVYSSLQREEPWEVYEKIDNPPGVIKDLYEKHESDKKNVTYP